MQLVTTRVIGVFIVLTACAATPVAQVRAQTQAAMNAEARADFKLADAELNKTYEAVLKKLPDAESKEKQSKASAYGSPSGMPRQRLRLTRRVAGQWLLQSATKP